MKHTLVSCELSKRSIEWKDRLAGYHLWKVTTRCPVDNRVITERVHGTKDQAINACVNNPECKCQEVANAH